MVLYSACFGFEVGAVGVWRGFTCRSLGTRKRQPCSSLIYCLLLNCSQWDLVLEFNHTFIAAVIHSMHYVCSLYTNCRLPMQ
jgi:hypothetical protein